MEILVDGHVHIHPTTNVGRLLDAACMNFSKYAKTPAAKSVLLLTESEGCDQYARMRRASSDDRTLGQSGGWQLAPTREPESLRAVHENGSTLYIIAGRQVVTRERLEVLAICTSALIEDGIAIRDAINRTIECGGVAVIPWGFGKWWGRRGRIVKALFETYENRSLFMGDNGGRLERWRDPQLFAVGEERGLIILAGTDPLPFRNEFRKVGRYGTRLQLEFDANYPAGSIRRALSSDCPAEVYGRRENLVSFLANQCRMQFRSRAARLRRKIG